MQSSYFIKRFLTNSFKTCITLIILFLQTSPTFSQSSQLTFSEVMFNPAEANGEFVEIFNTSLTDTIDLAGYSINYNNASSNDTMILISSSSKLNPEHYAIVLEGDYNFISGEYINIIPVNAVLFMISDNSFGTSTYGMAATSGKIVYLKNELGELVDAYTYSAGNSAGYSDEKIEMPKDNSVANWKNSISLHGTPGFKNSVSPLDYDLKIEFNVQSPVQPLQGDSINVTIVILNSGLNDAQNFVVNLYDDSNSDSIGQNDELLFTNNYVLLTNGDSIVLSKNIYADTAGVYSFIAEVIYTLDENNTNNKSILRFDVNEKPAGPFEIIINEIMYSPPPDQPEWIEIYNNSNRSFNLKKWKVGDNSSLVEFTSGDFFINPQEYLVISDEASITDFYMITSKLIIKSLPSLNNTGDEIRIKDENGTTIDSIKYFSSWGAPGKSLERISKDISGNSESNWQSSIALLKGTPGLDNSISQKNNDVCAKIISAPQNPFVGDNITINILVKNTGKLIAQNITVNLYDDANNDLIAQAYEQFAFKNIDVLNAGDSTSIGFILNISALRVYNLIAEVVCPADENPYNNNDLAKITPIEEPAGLYDIVINEFNYVPSTGEPEWIEIYNRSSVSINIKDWSIGNDGASVIITGNDLYINPKEYIVISRSSSLNKLHKINSKLIVKSFPALDNTNDVIALKNNYEGKIDEVSYSSGWGGGSGKSIERIDVNIKSSNAENWKTTESRFKGTPGRINSVSLKKHDLLVTVDKTKINYGEAGTPIDIAVSITNLGTEKVSGYSLFIFIDKNKNRLQNDDEILYDFSDLQLDAGNTYDHVFSIENLSIGKNTIYAFTKYDKDEYNDNDTADVLLHIVKINEVRGDIAINEIMYAPTSPEPEWIEIYNRSEKEINLQGYCIADDASKNEIVSSRLIIKPNEYFVFAKDSAIFSVYPNLNNIIVINLPSLNNSHDQIVLIDSLGRIIDSVKYNSNWGGDSGKSLERVEPGLSSTDSTNWNNPDVHVKATPSKINSVSPKEYDAAITGFFTIPHIPHYGEDVTTVIRVDNFGKQDAVFTVVLYELTEANTREIKEQTSQLRIAAESYLEYFFTHKISGINSAHILEAEILFEADEFPYNNKKTICIAPSCLPYKVLLNEIMYNPVNGEPEWIELYNTTEYDIDLSNWSITDLLTKPVPTKISSGVISSKSYLVIAKDSTVTDYHRTIPASTIINKFANLNNDEDGVTIKDCHGNTIDSVHYNKSWGGESGKSIERINLDSTSTGKQNWASSTDIELSTPGRINSISQKEHDLLVKDFCCQNKFVEFGKSSIVNAVIKNAGTNHAEFFRVELYFNSNALLTEQAILIESRDVSNLAAGDSFAVGFEISGSILGANNYLVTVDYPPDQYEENNSALCSVECIVLNEIYNDIVINEIMYNPVNGEPEWIELYNNLDYQIDLNGWTISDVLTNPVTVTLSSGVIRPKSFLVIAKDSGVIDFHEEVYPLSVNSFANLNNDEDGVVIKDRWGNTIDSVFYNKTWGGSNGKSLERISIRLSSNDKNNWAFSSDIELSTPGRINNVSPKDIDLAVYSIQTIPRFAFANDEIAVSAMIRNVGTLTAKNMKVEFYFIEGSDTIFISSEFIESINSQDSIEVSSSLKVKLVEPKTVFCKLLIEGDQDLSNNMFLTTITAGYKRSDILISEIMYNPFDGEPEWIEVVNNSSSKVNLKNWFVSDVVSPIKAVITKKDAIIETNEFAIVTRDSSTFSFYPPRNFYEAGFGSLGNTYDGIIIYDNNNNVIDSVEYNSHWGGTKGCSLERCNYNSNSCDSSIWSNSLCKDGATPGIKNTVSQINGYKRGSLVINEILYDPAANNCEFVEIFNQSEDSVELGGMYVVVGSNKACKISSTLNKIASKSFAVLGKDSTLKSNYSNLSGNCSYLFMNSILSLSNEGTTIVLHDARGNVLDSLYYASAWNNKNIPSTKNKSLEKINPYLDSNDPKNWSTCVCPEGATPGKQNSLFIEEVVSEKKVSINPNPFSPDNDGFEDFTAINLTLPHKLSQVRIKVFDSIGRLVRTLIHNMPSAYKSTVIFDGLDDNGRALRIGIYILLIEALGSDGNIETIKTPVVIARKL